MAWKRWRRTASISCNTKHVLSVRQLMLARVIGGECVDMKEPEAGTVIKFNTSHRVNGYTYVCFRIPGSRPGTESWYSTGVQQAACPKCHATDIWGELQDRFPFNGIVTWEQIVKFAADRPIRIATEWQVHPDWQRPDWYDRYFSERDLSPPV